MEPTALNYEIMLVPSLTPFHPCSAKQKAGWVEQGVDGNRHTVCFASSCMPSVWSMALLAELAP
jgi:hypothetical protein